MKRIMKVTIALSLFVLTLGAQYMLAAVIYVAGDCKPSLQSFTRIQDALNATPPPTTVLVCARPTPYPEQITISQPVNLQGISTGDQDRPVIAPPSGGLTQTATNNLGGAVFFQIFVNNVSGPVNISNLTVDGAGNAVPCCDTMTGIFFQNSPGSVKGVTARNQAGNGQGIAIWLEGGSANPAVSVTGSIARGFDSVGILSEDTAASTSQITAKISSNIVDASQAGGPGIDINEGATATVSSNSVIVANSVGIEAIGGAAGSISGNTVIGNGVSGSGIIILSDTVSVTGNKVLKVFDGILFASTVASVQGNSISDSANAGIDFGCNANSNVIHNTINDVPTGINNVPPLLTVSNNYFNVDRIRSQGGCP